MTDEPRIIITNHAEITLQHGHEVESNLIRRFLLGIPGDATLSAEVRVIRGDRPWEVEQKSVTIKASWSGNNVPSRKRGDIRD